MKAPVTSAQAMSHPTVIETINTLGKIADELRAERDVLKARLLPYESRDYKVIDESALILEVGRYHKWEDEDGIDWEWFSREVECDSCVDVALVRADKLAELMRSAEMKEMLEPVAVITECPVMGQQTVTEIQGRWKFLRKGDLLFVKSAQSKKVCFLCHGKGEYEMATAQLPGQPRIAPKMVKCTHCKGE